MKFLMSITLACTIFASLNANSSVSGQISGFETVNNNNIFNFGLALPVLQKEQLLDFNLNMFLSTETDTITALGQSIEVPSNLSIPDQRERYIFSIRFNKPSYRLPWEQNTELEGIGALEGQFAFRQVIDKVRGGAPLFSLINDFTFTSFSLKSVNTSVENLIVGETKHSHLMRLTGLTPESSPYITLAIALDSEDDNYFFPIDLKLLSVTETTDLRVTLNSHATLAIIPKSIFVQNTLKNTNIDMPFSIVWKAGAQNKALPMLTDLITATTSQLNLNTQEITKDHNVIGYKLSFLNANNNVVESTTTLGSLPESINFNNSGVSFSKIRLDVFASDAKSIIKSRSELIKATDYAARYEKSI